MRLPLDKKLFALLIVISFTKAWAVNSSRSCPLIPNITLNWVELQPFLGIDWMRNNLTGQHYGYLPYYTKIASYKCGCPMLHFNYQQMNISSSEEIEIQIRRSLRSTAPELYFPIFANRKESTQYQRPFLALFQSPGPAVVQVNRGSWHEKISISIILQTWPILSVCLLFGILAGFVVWAIEHQRNPEDFPAKFPHGALVGIWWSFVTMTTVGYGDKTTRTFWGRMFAVLWMGIGTVSMSMFTGQITANLTSNEMATVDLMDTKLAVPLGMKTFLEQEINLGARYYDMTYREMEEEGMFQVENIEYFLLHDYKIAENWVKHLPTLKNAKIVKIVDRQIFIGMVVTGAYTGPVKDRFTCLKREIVDLYQIEMAKQKLQSSTSSSSNGTQGSGLTSQHIFLIAGATIVVFLVLLGFLWECIWRRKTSSQTDIERSTSRSNSFARELPSIAS